MTEKKAIAESLIICNINNNMARKTTLVILLLIACVLPLAAVEDSAAVDPAVVDPATDTRAKRPVLGFGITGAVAVTDEPVGAGYPAGFFTPKAQAVGALSALLDVPLVYSFSLGIGFQLQGVAASNPAGGWTYPAHWGGGFRLSMGYGFELSEPSAALQVRLGTSAGGSANFHLQTFTTLFMFYPGIFLEPYLELDNPKREKRSIAVVLPIEYAFRRDYKFHGSIGIGIVRRYTLQ